MYRIVGEGKAYLDSLPEIVPSKERLLITASGDHLMSREYIRKGAAYRKAQLKKLRKRLKEKHKK